LGYKQSLARTWGLVESFGVSFGNLNFMLGLKAVFYVGLLAGGPAAMWSSFLIMGAFMIITAFVLAEVCSSLPLSGSIYVWAAQSASPKYARLVGTVVACWSIIAWISGISATGQLAANFVASELVVYDVYFPGGKTTGNVKWRVFIWAVAEGFMVLAAAVTYLPHKAYSKVLKLFIGLLVLDFLLCVTWFPIAASRTYGLRSAKDVFTQTYNGTGAPAGWNWLLCLLFTSWLTLGFDTGAYVAEETVNASVVAAKGILTSLIAAVILAFPAVILFLFSTPPLDVLFALESPQPFVQIFTMALGRGGSVFMTTISILECILSTSTATIAISRIIFAMARDGVLPGSTWIGQVSNGQPRNAVTITLVSSAVLLLLVIPSEVAFTSFISAAVSPIIASYGLIGFLRLTMTPNSFRSSKFRLGQLRKLYYAMTALFNAFFFAVLISPFHFPVDAQTFNFACLILGTVTIGALLVYTFSSKKDWLGHSAFALADANGIADARTERAIDTGISAIEK